MGSTGSTNHSLIPVTCRFPPRLRIWEILLCICSTVPEYQTSVLAARLVPLRCLLQEKKYSFKLGTGTIWLHKLRRCKDNWELSYPTSPSIPSSQQCVPDKPESFPLKNRYFSLLWKYGLDKFVSQRYEIQDAIWNTLWAKVLTVAISCLKLKNNCRFIN